MLAFIAIMVVVGVGTHLLGYDVDPSALVLVAFVSGLSLGLGWAFREMLGLAIFIVVCTVLLIFTMVSFSDATASSWSLDGSVALPIFSVIACFILGLRMGD